MSILNELYARYKNGESPIIVTQEEWDAAKEAMWGVSQFSSTDMVKYEIDEYGLKPVHKTMQEMKDEITEIRVRDVKVVVAK